MSLSGLARRRPPIDRVIAFFVGAAVVKAFVARERLGQSKHPPLCRFTRVSAGLPTPHGSLTEGLQNSERGVVA